MNDSQMNQVRMRLEHHFGEGPTIASCTAELRTAEYRDAIAAIDWLADDPKAPWRPTPAKLRQSLRKVLLHRKDKERSQRRADDVRREQERTDAYWRLAARTRKAIEGLAESECRDIVDAALADALWMQLPCGAEWYAQNMAACGSAKRMLCVPMIAVAMQAMIERGEVEDHEGAIDRTPEEVEAGRCADALLAKGFESLARRETAKPGGNTSGISAKMRA